MPRKIPKDEQNAEETDRLMHRLYREAAELELAGALPKGWDEVEARNPCAPPRTRVTLRLDTEVATFFRKMGGGHQNRMNDVLRCYMHAVLSGQIPGKWDWDAHRNPWWKATEFVRRGKEGRLEHVFRAPEPPPDEKSGKEKGDAERPEAGREGAGAGPGPA